MSSGRVVEITRSRPSGARNAMSCSVDVAGDRLEVGLGERRLHRRVPEHRLLGPVDRAPSRYRSRNDFCAVRRQWSSIVEYFRRQSTESPSLRQSARTRPRRLRVSSRHSARNSERGRVRLVDLVRLLDVALGREPVVVEPHRVEDLAAPHALVADDELRLRVRHRVARRAGARPTRRAAACRPRRSRPGASGSNR